jgi:hypothetical protein
VRGRTFSTRVLSTGSMRRIFLFFIVMAMTACRPTRTVRLGWDTPAVRPDGYRVLIDGHVVMDIPPPPIDPSCHCHTVAVAVPRGQHTVSVVAYNLSGTSPPSASVVVR